jgi:hypothetical protein
LGDLLREDTFRRYFDLDYLEGLLRSVDPTSWESGVVLWPILNFGLWHKHWIEETPLDDLVDRPAATQALPAV